MNGFVCGSTLLPEDIPDAGHGECCAGAYERGPRGCTCWTEVYDLPQADPQPGVPLPEIPVAMCEPGPAGGGCAYRHGSPEQDGDEAYQGDRYSLERLAATGEPFFCHHGIRRVIRYVHPSGAEYPATDADYQPPIRGRVPYRADGQPARICGGWLLRRAVLTRQEEATAR